MWWLQWYYSRCDDIQTCSLIHTHTFNNSTRNTSFSSYTALLCCIHIEWRSVEDWLFTFFTRYLKRSVRHALCRSCVVYSVNSSQPRLLHNTVWWTSAYEWLNKAKEQTHQTLEPYVVWVHTPRYCIVSVKSNNNNHFWTRSVSLLCRRHFFFCCERFISLIFENKQILI